MISSSPTALLMWKPSLFLGQIESHKKLIFSWLVKLEIYGAAHQMTPADGGLLNKRDASVQNCLGTEGFLSFFREVKKALAEIRILGFPPVYWRSNLIEDWTKYIAKEEILEVLPGGGHLRWWCVCVCGGVCVCVHRGNRICSQFPSSTES